MDAFLQTRLHFTNPEEGSSLIDQEEQPPSEDRFF
jgi:hypothetical protein